MEKLNHLRLYLLIGIDTNQTFIKQKKILRLGYQSLILPLVVPVIIIPIVVVMVVIVMLEMESMYIIIKYFFP